MEPRSEDVNLEEIQNMPEADFKRHFLDWIEDDGVTKALQAKLRKDLFDNFNKTNLGRQMYSKYEKTRQMMLSPLILALNTLVAEFLYAQNCHFTLSVFSSEVPYRNTLPNFESQDKFRFSRSDLLEIFEAIAVDMKTELRENILELYLLNSMPIDNSLLYCIFKNVFKRTEVLNEEPKNVQSTKKTPESEPRVTKTKDETSVCQNCKGLKKEFHSNFQNNQFRYLNKYLVILSQKVKEMSNNIDQLEAKQVKDSRVKQSSLKTRKIENLNRSLEKISDTLKLLSTSKRKNQKLSLVIGAVDKMAQQLEKCTNSFNRIAQNVTQKTKEDTNDSVIEPKRYSDWVNDLKNSKHGMKFIARIESCLRKTLGKEKEKIRKIFEERLENQKALIKIKYKQKLLEHLGSHTPAAPGEKQNSVDNVIQIKLKELDAKHLELVKKLNEVEQKTEYVTPFVDIDRDIEVASKPLKNPTQRQEQCQIGPNEIKSLSTLQTGSFTSPIAGRVLEAAMDPATGQASFSMADPIPHGSDFTPSSSRRNLIFSERFKPKLQELTKTIITQDKNIEHIVFDAKLRIQELEHESNQLERNFQDYLQKHSKEKTKFHADVSSILDNYNFGKSALSKKPITKGKLPLEMFQKPSDITENILMEKHLAKVTEKLKLKDPTFENPFRQLQQKWPSAREKTSSTKKVEKSASKIVLQTENRLEKFLPPKDTLRVESPVPNISIPEILEKEIENLENISGNLNLKDLSIEDFEDIDSDTSVSEVPSSPVEETVVAEVHPRPGITVTAERKSEEGKMSCKDSAKSPKNDESPGMQSPNLLQIPHEKLPSIVSSSQSDKESISIGNQTLSDEDFWD